MSLFRTGWIVVTCLCIVFLACKLRVALHVRNAGFRGQADCGLVALSRIRQLTGVLSGSSGGAIEEAPLEGFSLFEIQQTLEKDGIQSNLVFSPALLETSDSWLGIVKLTSPSHFLAISSNKGHLRYFDEHRRPVEVEADSLSERYSGFALVIDGKVTPTDNSTGPLLQVDSTWKDIGVLTASVDHNGKLPTFEFLLSNVGSEVLQISELRASCNCVGVSIVDKEIQPGGKTTLRLSVGNTAVDADGVFFQHVYVMSNCEKEPIVRLEVSGRTAGSISATPNRLDLGKCEIGRTLRTHIIVDFPVSDDLPVYELAAKTIGIDCGAASIRQVTVGEYNQFHRELAVGAPPLNARPGMVIFELQFTPCREGWIDCSIVVEDRDGSISSAVVPLRGFSLKPISFNSHLELPMHSMLKHG